jgi:DNA-directed RNA polymerase
MIKDMKKRNDMTSMKPIQMEFVKWFDPLTSAIRDEQEACLRRISAEDRSNYGPILVLLKPEKLAVISMHTVISEVLQSRQAVGTPFVTVVTAVGEAVRAELGVQKVMYERAFGDGTFKDSKIKELMKGTAPAKRGRKVAQIVRRAGEKTGGKGGKGDGHGTRKRVFIIVVIIIISLLTKHTHKPPHTSLRSAPRYTTG